MNKEGTLQENSVFYGKMFLCLERFRGREIYLWALLSTLSPPKGIVHGFGLVVPFLHSFPPKFYVGLHCAGYKKKYRLQLVIIILKSNLLYNRALDLIQEFRNIKQNNYKS